jgi:hypothetical protein
MKDSSMTTIYCNATQRLIDRLADLGFLQVGRASFASEKFGLKLDEPWSTFHVRRSSRTADPLSGLLGTPGPWKRIRHGEHWRMVADVPTALLHDDCDPIFTEDGNRPLVKLLDWLKDTSSRACFPTWQPPVLAEIESWYGPDKLVVSSGPYVRQGTLHRIAGRLSIQIPIVPVIPQQLPESRLKWLRAVLIDAQNRHRAARIGLVGEPPQQSIIAEVDLSGAPAEALPTLFTTSLAALKHTIQWSIQTAGFLVDLNLDCSALEVRPNPVD